MSRAADQAGNKLEEHSDCGQRAAQPLSTRGRHSHCGNLLYKSAFLHPETPLSPRPLTLSQCPTKITSVNSHSSNIIHLKVRFYTQCYLYYSVVDGGCSLRATAWSRILPSAASAGVPGGLWWSAWLSATATTSSSLCVRPKFLLECWD